jgi:hypothetical protein
MMAVLLIMAAHQCAVPAAAYAAALPGPLSRNEERSLERYARCVCGPDGVNDAPIVPDAHGRYAYDPKAACERAGWDNRQQRYRRAK